MLVTVIRVLVTLKLSGIVPVKSRIVTMLPERRPCATPVVIIAVLPESRSYVAVVTAENAVTVLVATVVGSGRPKS